MNLKDTLASVKETLGLQPQLIADNTYIPAESALKLAAPSKSDYDDSDYDISDYYHRDDDTPPTAAKKIMMVCTEQQYMTMADGKIFATGNQPIEMMVPMLHFIKAGFEVDVFTATGKPVQIEQWAMPEEDDNIKELYTQYQPKFNQPNSIADFVQNTLHTMDTMEDGGDYIAIFIPGGHGAMLGLPEDQYLGQLLRWGHNRGLFTLVICHGPAALLAANLDSPAVDQQPESSPAQQAAQPDAPNQPQPPFIYEGYEIVAFPDLMDKQMPKLGYLPSEMPWYFNEKLEALGVTISNRLAVGHTHRDRKLISGDGPLAANNFGKMSTKALLKMVSRDAQKKSKQASPKQVGSE